MNTTIITYKIRRKTDGLYSTRGRYPTFSKTGKIWKEKHHLKNHLRLYSTNTEYSDCEVVQFEMREISDLNTSVTDWLTEIAEQKEINKIKSQRRKNAIELKEKHELYLQLKQQFESNE